MLLLVGLHQLVRRGILSRPSRPNPYPHTVRPHKSISEKDTYTRTGVNHGSGVADSRRLNDGQIINRIMFLGDRSAATLQLWPWCNVMAGHWKKTRQALHLQTTLTICPDRLFEAFKKKKSAELWR